MTLVQTWSRLNRMNNDNLLRSLAALETWAICPDEEWGRSFKVELENSATDLHWTVALVFKNRTQDVHGRTMADALAQAAWVVINNPKLEE